MITLGKENQLKWPGYREHVVTHLEVMRDTVYPMCFPMERQPATPQGFEKEFQ